MHIITYPVTITKSGTFMAEAIINGRLLVVECETQDEAMLERSKAMAERLELIKASCDLAGQKAVAAFVKGLHKNPYDLGTDESAAFNRKYQALLDARRNESLSDYVN